MTRLFCWVVDSTKILRRVKDPTKKRETDDASFRLKQLERASPELVKQCTNEVRRIAQLILDTEYRNANINAETMPPLQSLEREHHSLPVFSRKEKAEYESWEAIMFEVDEEREPVKGKMLYVYLTVCLEKRGEW